MYITALTRLLQLRTRGLKCSITMGTEADRDLNNSISGPMTAALIGYSSTFMRYAMAVSPKNYLLFGCHLVNFGAQTTQGYRYINHWQYVH